MKLSKRQIFLISVAVIVVCVVLIVLFFPKNKIDAPVNGTNGVPRFALLTNWAGTNGQTVKALTADATNVYAAAGYDGLLVIRISDMSNIASFATNQPVNDVVLKMISTNRYAFIPLGTFNGYGGFLSLNITDLSNIYATHMYLEPTRNATAIDYVLARNGVRVVTADDFQGYQPYLVEWGGGTVTPEKPVPLGAKAVSDIFVYGTVAYVAAKDEGVFIIDTLGGRILSHIKPALSLANSVYVEGRILLVADKMNGIMIYDIGNPTSPQLLGDYDTPGDANDVWLIRNDIYIADGINGVMKVKWTPPNKFTLQRVYTDGSLAYHLHIAKDGKVFVACGNDGLKVLAETNIDELMMSTNTNAVTNSTVSNSRVRYQTTIVTNR